MQIKGLDVSEFQGNVDWEKVKAAGYQFAMLRAGYGFNTIDPQFKRNASECNRIKNFLRFSPMEIKKMRISCIL